MQVSTVLRREQPSTTPKTYEDAPGYHRPGNLRRTVVAAIEHQHGDQLRMTGEIWHRRRIRRLWPFKILCDTGAGGGSYMSGFLSRSLKEAR